MGFKEKVTDFWKKHWKKIVLAGGGVALAGTAVYRLYKSGQNGGDNTLYLEAPSESIEPTVEELTAWNKDWDEIGCELEFITRQPHGPFRDEDFVDVLTGNSFILAGPESFYNDDPNRIEIMCVDNDGYFHYMPDDVHYA